MTKAIEEVRQDLGFRPEESRGLFVGVDKFDERELPSLQFAVDDAVDLAFLFSCELELVRPDRIHLALAGSPQKRETADQLEWLLREGALQVEAKFVNLLRLVKDLGKGTGPAGLWVVAFSTHGFLDLGRDFVVTADSFIGSMAATAIPSSSLLDQLSQASTSRRLLLLDTCRSRLPPGIRGSAETVDAGMSGSLAHALANASGLAVLSSTTLGGFSYEHQEIENGVFTSAFLRGLRGGALADQEGFVTVNTLADYVNDEVVAWVKEKRPYHAKVSTGITRNLQGLAGALPLASSDPQDVERREYCRLRELALIRLQHNIGPIITGRHFDEIKQLTRNGPSTPELKAFLRQITELDKTVTAQRALLYTLQHLGDHRRRERFHQGIDEMYGLKGSVDECGAKASFLAAAETGDPLARIWLARLRQEGACSFARDPSAARSLRRDDLAAMEALATRDDRDAALIFGFALIDGVGVEMNRERGASFLEQAARQGDTVAMNCLGWLKDAKDPAMAVGWYRRGADGGNAIAMVNLASCYWRGHGVAKDEREAIGWYRRAADRGSSLAMNRLGSLYRESHGEVRDYSAARQWFRLAAERGNAEALVELGWMANKGEGGSKSPEEAVRWFQKAVEQGSTPGMRSLAAMYADGAGVPKDFARALRLWHQAADLNDAISLLTLGEIYDDGTGVAPQPEVAADLFRRAAEAGNAEAAARLASLYTAGRGVPQNLAEATRWRQLAAERGHVTAMYELAATYENGTGVVPDPAQALAWYQKAAAGGHAGAMYELGVSYHLGTLQPQDFANALHWYSLAIQGGVASAMNNLGVIYENGQGVTRNLREAARWYGQAADQGNAFGMFNLGRAYKDGNGVPKDLAKARVWLQRASDHGYSDAEVLLKAIGAGGVAENLAQMWRKWLS
jgi:TPR repeat protein